jgi:hypothetical protein
MFLVDWVARFVAFVRAGYPTGMPATGYVPLAALLRRRLCDDEITAITNELMIADVGRSAPPMSRWKSPASLTRCLRRMTSNVSNVGLKRSAVRAYASPNDLDV